MAIITRHIQALLTAAVTVTALALTGCNDNGTKPNGGRIPTEIGKTQDGHNVSVFKKERLESVLVGIDTAGWEDNGTSTLTFNGLSASEVPEVGDIIASPITKAAPGGFLFKVTGVTTDDGGVTTVAVRQARIEEAVKNGEMKSETKMEFDKDGNLLRTTQRVIQAGGDMAAVTQGIDIDIESSVSGSLKLKADLHYQEFVEISKAGDGGGAVDRGVKITEARFSVDVDYTLTFIFDLKVTDYTVEYAKVSFKPSGHIYTGSSITGQINGKMSDDATKLFTIKVGNIQTHIGVLPVIFTDVEINLHLLLAGEAELELSSACSTKNISGEFGFEYYDGKWPKGINTLKSDKTAEYTHSVSGTVSVGIATHITGHLYKYKKSTIDLSSAPNIRLTVNAQSAKGVHAYDEGFKNSDANKTSIDLCLDLGAEAKVEALGYEVKVSLDTSSVIANIAQSNALPIFDDISLFAGADSVKFRSWVSMGAFAMSVSEYGFWAGPSAHGTDGFRGGWGKHIVSDKKITPGDTLYVNLSVPVSDLGYGAFYVRPYFKNTAGGIYYDKVYTLSVNSVNRCTEADMCGQIVIGGQKWMTENLNVETADSWCYGGKTDSCDKYGRLYTWNAAKNACPTGWKLPSKEEWQTLIDFAGGDGTAGNNLKSTSGWFANTGSTDRYGFSALPGGYRETAGTFKDATQYGYWWTASENGNDAYNRSIFTQNGTVSVSSKNKGLGYSVRCLAEYGGGDLYCTWTPWTVTTPATCAAEGVETRTCPQTGAKETRAVAKLTGAGCSTGPGDGVIGNNNCTSAATCKSKQMPDGKVWMTENLNIATDSSWCYGNSPDSCAKYGRLYAWNAAKAACPSGWHLSTNNEWSNLIEVGSSWVNAGMKFKSTSGWESYSGISSTDEYGFSALPGGMRDPNAESYATFAAAGRRGYWWIATLYGSDYRYMAYDHDYADVTSATKSSGFSVRCVAD